MERSVDLHDRSRRGHAVVGHTADVGLRATAPKVEALFEEAAAALAELGADVGRTDRLQSVSIEIAAEDLEQLAYRWLNELIGQSDERGEALARTEVAGIESSEEGCVLRGRAWFAPFDWLEVRPRIGVKAATMHRLRVARTPDGWELEAYLDI